MKKLFPALLLMLSLPLTTYAVNSYEDIIDIYATQGVEKAVTALHELAEFGDVRAEYRLGVMYLFGEDIDASSEKAQLWLEKAAKQDHQAAMLTLSKAYTSGLGLSLDNEKAIYWFQQAEILEKKAKAAQGEEFDVDSDCD